MPIYEFKCSSCSFVFEDVQGIKEPPLLFCPRCQGEVDRKFYDWEQKLSEFRKFHRQIAQAPVLPYFLLIYLLVLLMMGILGGIVYQDLLGFLGMIIFSVGITLTGILGALPVVGPFMYLLWLGPVMKHTVAIQLGLHATMLSGLVYWTGFGFSLLFAVITTFITIFWIITPVMWCFMKPDVQEKMKYLLLIHLLNYNVYPVWIEPDSFKARFLGLLFGLKEFPAIRLKGVNYYAQDIPVKPLKIIEQKKT